MQGETGAGGGESCSVGEGDFFFFFKKPKSRNYLKIILKHSFYGDCCPGQSERARARPTAGVFFVSSLDVLFLVGDTAQ